MKKPSKKQAAKHHESRWKPVESAPLGRHALFISDETNGHGFSIPAVGRALLIDGEKTVLILADDPVLGFVQEFCGATHWHPLPPAPVIRNRES